METPQPDNQEPKDPNSPRSPHKATRKRNRLVRLGIPVLVGLMGVVLAGIIVARVVGGDISHFIIE